MRTTVLLVMLCLLLPGLAPAAVTIHECEDSNGVTYFADRCPPGNRELGQRRLRTLAPPSPDDTEIAEKFPVTFYAIAECDACDLVRNQLRKRGIPFTEKNVSSDLAVQAELKALAGGLTIPLVHVGEQTVTGYNKQVLDDALTAVGYADGDEPGDAAPE